MPVKEICVYDVTTDLCPTVRLRKGGLETVGWLLEMVERELERLLRSRSDTAASASVVVEIDSLLAGKRKLDSKAWNKPVHMFFLYGYAWVIKSQIYTHTGQKLSVHVKTLTGKQETFLVHSGMKVAQLKEKIAKSEIAEPVDLQRITFCAKQLEDEQTLDSYGMPDKATLNLVRRIPGGRSNRLQGVQFIDPKRNEGFVESSGAHPHLHGVTLCLALVWKVCAKTGAARPAANVWLST